MNTVGGLSIHMLQVHKEELKTVPNAITGRESTEYEIFGMEGIPDEDDSANEDPSKKARLELPLPGAPWSQFPGATGAYPKPPAQLPYPNTGYSRPPYPGAQYPQPSYPKPPIPQAPYSVPVATPPPLLMTNGTSLVSPPSRPSVGFTAPLPIGTPPLPAVSTPAFAAYAPPPGQPVLAPVPAPVPPGSPKAEGAAEPRLIYSDNDVSMEEKRAAHYLSKAVRA